MVSITKKNLSLSRKRARRSGSIQTAVKLLAVYVISTSVAFYWQFEWIGSDPDLSLRGSYREDKQDRSNRVLFNHQKYEVSQTVRTGPIKDLVSRPRTVLLSSGTDNNWIKNRRTRVLEVSDRPTIHGSEWYDDIRHARYQPYANDFECKPLDWQTTSFPTCNTLHEGTMENPRLVLGRHGFFRDVWLTQDEDVATSNKLALKTLRMKRDVDLRTFDMHRMDAVASERLTSSSLVVNIFGYCGNSAIYEYGEGGSIDQAVWNFDHPVPYLERLRIAVSIAKAIATVHDMNIVHADIMTSQFILVNGEYKLNDFNRCTFQYWNTTSNTETCPYLYPDENIWLFRSPEEYAYQRQTEKIDVYSMGNIFYMLLEDELPWFELNKVKGQKAVEKAVLAGQRPIITSAARDSADPAVNALRHAMNLCWTHDWRNRPSARDVERDLADALHRIEQTL